MHHPHHLISEVRDYAANNYYRHSWDIVALEWTDAQIAEAIAGAKTRRGAIAKTWGKLQTIHARRPAWMRPSRPLSLIEFLASQGGIRSDDRMIGDLRSILDPNTFVPRFGWLIRERKPLSTAAQMGGHRQAMSLDDARALAVAAGYLQDTHWEGGIAVSTISDLLEAIDAEARGGAIYPYGQAPFDPTDIQPEEAKDAIPF